MRGAYPALPRMCDGAGVARARLPVREPYDWERVLDWLGTRVIPGLEVVEDGMYRRGEIVVERIERGLAITGPADPAVAARVFDTEHDPANLAGRPAVRACARDPRARRVERLGARRARGPRAAGQRCRARNDRRRSSSPPLGRATAPFPTPQAVAEGALPGMPAGRERALRALAGAVAGGPAPGSAARRRRTRAALLALPGFGPWTVEYIAMRALRDRDAWPGTDLWLRRAASGADRGALVTVACVCGDGIWQPGATPSTPVLSATRTTPRHDRGRRPGCARRR